MKIAKLEVIPMGIPFTNPGPPVMFMGKARTVYEFALVRVETDEGHVGYGESHGFVWRAIQALIEDRFRHGLVGRDATDISGVMRHLRQTFSGLGGGIAAFALSAIDIALWDIAGKAAGLPLHRLFGVGSPKPPTTYASIGWYQGADTVAKATMAAVEAGFKHVKLHSVAADELAAARAAVGPDIKLMVDASARWSPLEAREAARRLEPHDIFWLEEPIAPPIDYGGLSRLRGEIGIPVAAGENCNTAFELHTMLTARAVDFATPCVNKIGGVTEFRKATAIAEAHGVELAAQGMCHGPAFLATLHVMAGIPGRALVEKVFATFEAPLAGFAGQPANGQFVIPDGPGLGHDPDPDAIKTYRIGG